MKEKIIKQNTILAEKGMDQSDLYMFDFVRFINEKVSPHITIYGLKLLKEEYESWILETEGKE